jgi:hypothetical protein
VLQRVAVGSDSLGLASVLLGFMRGRPGVAVRCIVLHCVALCCILLHFVAVCCGWIRFTKGLIGVSIAREEGNEFVTCDTCVMSS